jgi:hypothetical protein
MQISARTLRTLRAAPGLGADTLVAAVEEINGLEDWKVSDARSATDLAKRLYELFTGSEAAGKQVPVLHNESG